MQGILINGQFPGPDIECVTNDNLIINVHNNLPEPFLLSWLALPLSVSLSVSVSLYLPLSVSLSLSPSVSLYLSLSVSLSISFYPPLSLSLYLPLSLTHTHQDQWIYSAANVYLCIMSCFKSSNGV